MHTKRLAGLASLAAGLVLSVSVPSSADTTAENLSKYQALRSRFTSDFVRVGSDPGDSIPASNRHATDTYIRWGDATIRLGWYLGLLATEHALLSDPATYPGFARGDGGDLAETERELFFALNALERLDKQAEPSFDPPCDQTSKTDGFFIRDDVPATYHQKFPGRTSTLSDFLDSPPTQKEMSQDQVYHLLLGIGLIKALVPASVVQNGTPLRAWAIEQAERMVAHVAKDNWVIKNPACENRDVARGPSAGPFSLGTKRAISFITDAGYEPTQDPLSDGIWPLGTDPNGISYVNPTNMHMAMAIAAVGVGWEADTAKALTDLAPRHDWPFYGVVFPVMHGHAASNWCATRDPVVERSRAMLDELPTGAEPVSPWPGPAASHGFTTSNRFIREKSEAYVGTENSEGRTYNGLDYLLLHNAYTLAAPHLYESAQNADPCDSLPPGAGGTGAGGSGSGMGGSAGSTTGVGGASGGAPAGGNGGGGTGGAANVSPSSGGDDGGCGCRTVPTTARSGWLNALLGSAR